jgi:hypothetical protein
MPDTDTYRRRGNLDTWHRRVDCSYWPRDDAPDLETLPAGEWRPALGALCTQCRARGDKGAIRAGAIALGKLTCCRDTAPLDTVSVLMYYLPKFDHLFYQEAARMT